jgi:hypothetical protein
MYLQIFYYYFEPSSRPLQVSSVVLYLDFYLDFSLWRRRGWPPLCVSGFQSIAMEWLASVVHYLDFNLWRRRGWPPWCTTWNSIYDEGGAASVVHYLDFNLWRRRGWPPWCSTWNSVHGKGGAGLHGVLAPGLSCPLLLSTQEMDFM